jgi:hypothetical protein
LKVFGCFGTLTAGLGHLHQLQQQHQQRLWPPAAATAAATGRAAAVSRARLEQCSNCFRHVVCRGGWADATGSAGRRCSCSSASGAGVALDPAQVATAVNPVARLGLTSCCTVRLLLPCWAGAQHSNRKQCNIAAAQQGSYARERVFRHELGGSGQVAWVLQYNRHDHSCCRKSAAECPVRLRQPDCSCFSNCCNSSCPSCG